MRAKLLVALTLIILPGITLGQRASSGPDADQLPTYLKDRGTGVPTSMFGTYVNKGEVLIYPFFEYYRDNDMEYSPQELGYVLDQDFRGRYRASEGLIFIGYGLAKNISVEAEIAVIDATLHKSPKDPTDLPEKISESGLGDVQTQVNWSWMRETEKRPELFSYLEVVYPSTDEFSLIGTTDWEFKVGTGVIRGFGWGTTTFRVAAEYDRSENKTEVGEMAVEYLKRLSQSWRAYVGVEGSQDEWELITEAQWHFFDNAFVKLNSAYGITSKATDWAPEIGIMFRIR